MERLVALWVPSLSASGDDAAWRRYLALLDDVAALCPFVDPVRLGLMVLPSRGPSRFFGGEDVVVSHLHQLATRALGDETLCVGVANGLFSAFAAARSSVVVPAGSDERFRRALPISALERRQLATLCRRLGMHTVGSFADLDPARVAERFDRDALHVHRVARGVEGELVGQRDLRLAQRLRVLRGEDRPRESQAGFFGDHLDADRRAHAVANRVRLRLGPDGVGVATLVGGRSPVERGALVPFGSEVTLEEPAGSWPGRLPAPSPASTLARPVAVELLDEKDQPVRVDARGLLGTTPASVRFDRGVTRHVEWCAGPWPSVEKWWSTRRRRAHLQVLTGSEALLLVAERGRWWLVGVYD